MASRGAKGSSNVTLFYIKLFHWLMQLPWTNCSNNYSARMAGYTDWQKIEFTNDATAFSVADGARPDSCVRACPGGHTVIPELEIEA